MQIQASPGIYSDNWHLCSKCDMLQIPQIYIQLKCSWSVCACWPVIRTAIIWSAYPVRLIAVQISQTWSRIPFFLFEQNLGSESKKGHAWEELRYVSEYPAFSYRKDCSSTNHYSAVCLSLCASPAPGTWHEEMARAEQSSTSSSKPFFTQHRSLLPVASEAQVGLWQKCLGRNRVGGAQWWKCLELARQLLPACSSGVAIASWQYTSQRCPQHFFLPCCHKPYVSMLHRLKIAT